MKKISLISKFLWLTSLSLGSLVASANPQYCDQLAQHMAHHAANDFCTGLKNSYKGAEVYKPQGLLGLRVCEASHTNKCIALLSQLVSQDRVCSDLYPQDFQVYMDDVLAGTRTVITPQAFYTIAQHSCILHPGSAAETDLPNEN